MGPHTAGPANELDELPAGAASPRGRGETQRPRPSEIDRPDVAAKREAFVTQFRRSGGERLASVQCSGTQRSRR